MLISNLKTARTSSIQSTLTQWYSAMFVLSLLLQVLASETANICERGFDCETHEVHAVSQRRLMFWWLPAADVIAVASTVSANHWQEAKIPGVTVYSPLNGSAYPHGRPVPVLFYAPAPLYGGRVRIFFDGASAGPDFVIPPPTGGGGGGGWNLPGATGRLATPLQPGPGPHVIAVSLVADDFPGACAACLPGAGAGAGDGGCGTCGRVVSEVWVEWTVHGDEDEGLEPARGPAALVTSLRARGRSAAATRLNRRGDAPGRRTARRVRRALAHCPKGGTAAGINARV